MDTRGSRIATECCTIALTLGLAGCGSATGPEDTGLISVSMSRTSGAASASLTIDTPRLLASVRGAFDIVPVEAVAGLTVNVTAIEAHRVGSEDEASSEGSEDAGAAGEEAGSGETGEGDGPWIRIELTPEADEEVDMLNLPQTDEPSTGFEVAVQAVPAGTYNMIRLFIDGVSISFAEDVTVDGTVYEANTEVSLQVTVPSAEQTGILVQTGFFEVPEGGMAGILVIFDPETSLKNVALNANGLSLTPVMVGTVEVVNNAPSSAP